MTQTGQVLGTAAYISPEQALGQPAGPASDRYALAVVAQELLTGSRPFAGGPPTAQARQHAEAQPSRPSQAVPELPPALDAVLARGLAKDPRHRPPTATELVTAIESALGERPAEPTRPLPAVAPTPRPRVTPLRPMPPSPAPAAAAVQAAPATGRERAAPAPRAPSIAEPPTAGRDRPPAGRHAPWPALLAAALVVAVVVGLAIALGGGGGAEPRREAGARTTKAPVSGSSRTATAAAASAPQPAGGSGDGGSSPSALNDRGYALLKQGRYGEAVEPLRAAVQGYRAAGTGGLPYAYALFNLAVALNRSGNPAEAVPLLRERLKFDDQRKTVQAELEDALAKLGTAPPPGPGKHEGKQKGKRDKG
jgi:serine/threonine-protein kinase